MTSSFYSIPRKQLFSYTKRCRICQRLIVLPHFNYQLESCNCFPIDQIGLTTSRTFGDNAMLETEGENIVLPQSITEDRKGSERKMGYGLMKLGRNSGVVGREGEQEGEIWNIGCSSFYQERENGNTVQKTIQWISSSKAERTAKAKQKMTQRQRNEEQGLESYTLPKKWKYNFQKEAQLTPYYYGHDNENYFKQLQQQNSLPFTSQKKLYFSAPEIRKKQLFDQSHLKEDVQINKSQDQSQGDQSINYLEYRWKRYTESTKRKLEEEEIEKEKIQGIEKCRLSNRSKELERQCYRQSRKKYEEERDQSYMASRQICKQLKKVEEEKKRRLEHENEVNKFIEEVEKILSFVSASLSQNENISSNIAELKKIKQTAHKIRRLSSTDNGQRTEENILRGLKEVKQYINHRIGVELVRRFHDSFVLQFNMLINESNQSIGFTKQEIKQHLTEREVEKDDQSCSICLQGMVKGLKGTYLQCQHFFHQECIQIWLIHSKNCPICRKMQTLKQ